MGILSAKPLSGLLRGSPFKPIKQHMARVFDCTCQLPGLFDALYKRDDRQLALIAEDIIRIESEADKIKADFRLSMPKSLLLPVDRKDLLELISTQDEIADTVEEIAQILLFRDMKVPDALKEELDALLEGTMEISSNTNTMIGKLDEFIDAGFGARDDGRNIEMITTVRKGEHNIDVILHRTRRTLFEAEATLDPVSVMFWYEILGLVGRVSDLSENIADRLLLFMSK